MYRQTEQKKVRIRKLKYSVMNSNILAYIFYIVITLFIIYRIGKMFHQNGRIFILQLYRGDAPATDTINNILLVAYYLFNMGYAFVTLRYWEKVVSVGQLITSLGEHIGILVLILAITHYFNMFTIYQLSKKHDKTFTS